MSSTDLYMFVRQKGDTYTVVNSRDIEEKKEIPNSLWLCEPNELPIKLWYYNPDGSYWESWSKTKGEWVSDQPTDELRMLALTGVLDHD